MIRNVYWDQTAAVRIDKEISEGRSIRRVLRQGFVLSLDFFHHLQRKLMIPSSINTFNGVKEVVGKREGGGGGGGEVAAVRVKFGFKYHFLVLVF